MTLGTPTLLTSGTAATATVTVSFTAQPAGTLLYLTEVGDDYRTTAGTGRPESTGWTLDSPGGDQHTFEGHAAWWKLTDGIETSVQYTIGSATKSSYVLGACTGVDQTTPLNIAAGQFQQTSTTTYTTPAVTPTGGGQVVAFGTIGGSNSSATISPMSTWLNSYTVLGTATSATAPFECVGLAYKILTAGSSTSTGATFFAAGQSKTGIIAAFNEAAATAARTNLRGGNRAAIVRASTI